MDRGSIPEARNNLAFYWTDDWSMAGRSSADSSLIL